MTREEAITFMRKVWREAIKGSYAEEAYGMAIEALKERPTGKWRKFTPEEDEYLSFMGWLECTNCKSKAVIRSDFCPNCGADMSEEEVG